MTKPLVAVLGCGPSGLLAALALDQYGIPFSIFSKYQKSQLGGAQFSHIEIPGMTEEPEVVLRYVVRGESSVYQNKVYGEMPVPFVSFDGVYDGKEVPAWNLRGIYNALWERYAPNIVQTDITPQSIARFETGPFDLVFSSVPLVSVCAARVDPEIHHRFRSVKVQILNEALETSIPDNTIVYDGTKDHSYYRMSKIFGVGATEWGGSSPIPPLSGIKTVSKPTETNCNCWPSIQRIGRFGTWRKGILTMHAYRKVVETIQVMENDL
jgi:hypothetical protein